MLIISKGKNSTFRRKTKGMSPRDRIESVYERNEGYKIKGNDEAVEQIIEEVEDG